MTSTPQKYVGLYVNQARQKVVADLSEAGLIKKIEKIKHVVGVCYRDKSIIEPMISKQWFIKVKPLTKEALNAIKTRKVKIVSAKYEKIARHWLKNLKDWNISRQIVWGIRIPAWRCDRCLSWVITEGTEPTECTECKYSKLTQDQDTFDTWFSSGQWPYATLQTTKRGDFEYFYPTSLMNTAYDILPFWVIRMIMLGLYATGEVPFREVLFHGLVRDREGQKISKSKGNVINPIEMAEKYGADALRMGLIWGALVENDIALSEDNIRGQRNFANKLWNVSRFVLSYKSEIPNSKFQIAKPRVKNEDDRWILTELKKSQKKITKLLDKYRLNEAAEELYTFIWKRFADIYIEKVKERKSDWVKVRDSTKPVLEYVLYCSLVMAHPFMPFITEAIYKETGTKGLLIDSSWN
jgi:valyl-tRNA synthetase